MTGTIIKSSHHNRTYFYTRPEDTRVPGWEIGIVFRRAARLWVAKRIVGNGYVETEHVTRSEAEAIFGEAEEVGR